MLLNTFLSQLCYFLVLGLLYVLAGIFEMLMILTMAKSESFPNRNNMERTVEVEEKLISSHVIQVKQLNDLSLVLSDDAGNSIHTNER